MYNWLSFWIVVVGVIVPTILDVSVIGFN